jgi:hypothetical protein
MQKLVASNIRDEILGHVPYIYNNQPTNQGSPQKPQYPCDYTYRVIQEESGILWNITVCVILSKKVYINMGPILNSYQDMVKRKYIPSCEHKQQLCDKKHHN